MVGAAPGFGAQRLVQDLLAEFLVIAERQFGVSTKSSTNRTITQHFFDLSPMVYFIHFRAVGDPVHLAQSAAAAVSATATPLPQPMPMHPSTPLDSAALGQALGGDAMVGSDGVVTVTIPRQNNFTLGGVPTQSDTGLASTVAFEPLAGGQTAVAPDFALTAAEVQPVMQTMRGQGFTIHCLYNQETAENPQLYFSHQLKTGDALQLAQQIRKGLDQTNSLGSQAATPPSGGANTGAGGTAGGRPLGELAGGIAALAAALLAGAAVIRRRSTNHT